MQQAFTLSATEGKARAGQLTTKHGTIQTPAALIYTRRGGPLSMTPDLIETLQPQGFQVDVLHL